MTTTAKPLPASATFYCVPAGAKSSKCRGPSCGRSIYFITNPKTGRMLPVDCDVPGGERPSDTDDKSQLDMLSGGAANVHDGKGVSHFLTCADVDMFTKRGG